MRFFSSGKKHIESDTELINLYQQTGNNKYVGVLFERYFHLVYGVCLKYLKDEETSRDEVFRIFENLFNLLKQSQITYFTTWLHSVVKNHCLMHLRAKQRRDNRLNNYLSMEWQETEDDHFDMTEILHTQLQEAIRNLDQEQKTCIELFYLQGKCYNEVSKITGYSLKQVKSYIQNGKRNLKIIITRTVQINK